MLLALMHDSTWTMHTLSEDDGARGGDTKRARRTTSMTCAASDQSRGAAIRRTDSPQLNGHGR
jgi:hypothetical protein